ncbi:MAG: histone deacetylase [Spirochaetaceae bacterium]
MKVALVRDPLYLEHTNGAGHPERPERLTAVDEAIEGVAFSDELLDLPARDADHDELARIHDRDYIRRIAGTEGERLRMLDADTGAAPGSYRAALRAAGGAITAVDAVLTGEVRRSFALPRPPGHHAEQNRAMGFCLFNNIAVAARHAQAAYGLERVAVIDWDVHHGNGTQWSFYEDPSVLYVSIHEYPLFPGTGLLQDTGRDIGGGYTVNLPLPAGETDRDYAVAFEEVVLPVVREFDPQLLLVSAGFDAHRDDPLARMRLSVDGFRWMTRALVELAEHHADGRIVHVLEGGYNLAALSEGVAAVLEELTGDRLREREPAAHRSEASEGLQAVLAKGERVFPRHWASLA